MDLVIHLLSEYLTVDSFINMIIRLKEEMGGDFETSWSIRDAIEKASPFSYSSIELRDQLAQLILSHKVISSYDFESTFRVFAAPLAILCSKQFTFLGEKRPDKNLITASVIAVKFYQDHLSIYDDAKNTLIKQMQAYEEIKSIVLQEEIKLEVEKNSHTQKQNFWGIYSDLKFIHPLLDSDWEWLIQSLQDNSYEYKEVVLYLTLDLWNQKGRQDSDKRCITKSIHDDTTLQKITDKRFSLYAKWEEEDLQRQKLHQEKDSNKRTINKATIDDWLNWKNELKPNLSIENTLDEKVVRYADVYKWLTLYSRVHSKVSWNKRIVSTVFGQDIAKDVEQAWKTLWRTLLATTYSKSGEPKENEIYAINGLYAESQQLNWTDNLSDKEVELATCLCTLSLPSMGNTLSDLTLAYPDKVIPLLGEELIKQLEQVKNENYYIPLIHEFNFNNVNVHQGIAPYLLEWLLSLGLDNDFWTVKPPRGRLEEVFKVLSHLEEKLCAIRLYKQLLAQSDDIYFICTLLRGLYLLDAIEATKETVLILNTFQEQEGTAEEIEKFIASIFSRLWHGSNIDFLKIHDKEETAQVLKELVLVVYQAIKPCDDEDKKKRRGMYAPSSRGKAESARQSLLSELTSLSGATAYKMLIELSKEPACSTITESLKYWAKNKAARDAEPSVYNSSDISTLVKENELPPNNHDSLFKVMMERLSDIQHDLDNHSFSIKEHWQKCTIEAQVQTLLAKELDEKRRSAYTVDREVEVINGKKPDLQLTTVNGHHKAIIEMKYANNWTVNELEKALEEQLVGQYLRHNNCRAGCLFISLHQPKKWSLTAGEDKKLINFNTLIKHLKSKAEQLEIEHGGNIRLSIFGLDLTSI